MRPVTIALALAALAAPPPPLFAAQRPAADTNDVRSIDAILHALYNVISGPAGPRNWGRFRSLFWPGARLIPTAVRPDSGPRATVLDPDGYAARAGPRFLQTGFFEREVSRRVERFGNIAHAFSTYESRHAAADSLPFARGINSIQLFFDGRRWWVVTVLWDAERPGLTIPPEYLPRPPSSP
jgi:hypothetical protein